MLNNYGARLSQALYSATLTARADAFHGYAVMIEYKKNGKEKTFDVDVEASSEQTAFNKARAALKAKVGDYEMTSEQIQRMDSTRADADREGQRVRITGGMKEFHGKTGTIQYKEGRMYRVKLDSPVEIPNVGRVTDDLWEGGYLKRIDSERADVGESDDKAIKKTIFWLKQDIKGYQSQMKKETDVRVIQDYQDRIATKEREIKIFEGRIDSKERADAIRPDPSVMSAAALNGDGSIHAAVDTMVEQLNSLGKHAAGLVERATRSDAEFHVISGSTGKTLKVLPTREAAETWQGNRGLSDARIVRKDADPKKVNHPPMVMYKGKKYYKSGSTETRFKDGATVHEYLSDDDWQVFRDPDGNVFVD